MIRHTILLNKIIFFIHQPGKGGESKDPNAAVLTRGEKEQVSLTPNFPFFPTLELFWC